MVLRMLQFVSMVTFAFLLSLLGSSFADEPVKQSLLVAKGPKVVPGEPGVLLRSMLDVARQSTPAERPEATTVRARGAGANVYPDVAPAVVLVSTQTGHGTGFFISEDGWILTNAHVVDGAAYNHEHHGNLVRILPGLVGSDGWMVESSQQLSAIVYRVSQRQDLALLKLTELPKDAESVPFLRLAQSIPKPGSECVAIGHPGIGALWSVRQGQVTGVGVFPRDQAGIIAGLLQVSSAERKELEEQLASHAEQKQVLQSNCEISGGDSGGPLVNSRGEVIAVTFAIRSAESAGKLSLHVHLDEVKQFIQDFPSEPEVQLPGAYPQGDAEAVPVDVDSDGNPDALLFTYADSATPDCLQIQLSAEEPAVSKSGREINNADDARIPDWRPNFSIYRSPALTVLYDGDGDGEFDRIFRDEDSDGTAETLYSQTEGSWEVSLTDHEAVSATNFASERLQAAFGVWEAEVKNLADLWGRAAVGQ